MTDAREAESSLPKVENLRLTDNTRLPIDEDAENVWKDTAKASLNLKSEVPTTAPPSFDPSAASGFALTPTPQPSAAQTRLHTPDPSSLDASVAGGFKSDTEAKDASLTRNILNEFDPLESHEEKLARDAWSQAQDNSPPPAPPEKSPPPTPRKDVVQPSSAVSASPSSFPSSLTALARTFSIPKMSRSRPVSLDAANSVPSPATLSSFADQQQQQQPQPPPRSSQQETPRSSTSNDEPAFDFQKFLDQMKTRSAEPVSKYLKSFLANFSKRVFTVNDQIKIINDFLNFISRQMRECDIWRNASDAEFDNAMEGMEKLVMNQLYQYTFTPQVALLVPKRQITADDLERDRVLKERTALFGWLEEKHLDVPEGEGSKGFLMFAEQELLKINHYKAPRDKLICILNCCKVIFGLIRHLQKDEGADSFVPILIFVVLKANPDHLLSNIEFINRFRNPDKLQSEAGYYLSSLMGAVSFVETMDHSSLSNISREEFEKNVEQAIALLPPAESQPPSTPMKRPSTSHVGEESAEPLSLPTPAQLLSEDAKRLLQRTGDTISRPLSALSRIFNEALDNAEETFSNFPDPFGSPPGAQHQHQQQQYQAAAASSPSPAWNHPDQIRRYSPAPGAVPQTPAGPLGHEGQGGFQNSAMQTPYKARVRRVTPSSSYSGTPSGLGPEDTPTRSTLAPSHTMPRMSSMVDAGSKTTSRAPTPSNLDLAGMQAEIDQAHEQAGAAAMETLRQIFPTVDQEVMGWVLEANNGDLGKSIEQLLEVSTAD